MLFSQSLGLGTAFGHRGETSDHTTLLVAMPEYRVAVAVLVADGKKNVETVMTELLTAVQPLLGG